MNKDIQTLYRTDNYLLKNPTLHEEDSPWKVSQIIPLIDQLVNNYWHKKEINILDVGGGAGLILRKISSYLSKKYGFKVNQFALDLSPGMLAIQKKNNPTLQKVFYEDIRQTSIKHKKIDLALMIDVLEHIPDPTKALNELKRISRFVILKVPLEDNLTLNIWNLINRGRPRQYSLETVGHLNIYNFRKLVPQIEKYLGQILQSNFTNVFSYFRRSAYYQKKQKTKNKIINFVAINLFKISPRICSLIFNDCAMLLVKCW